MLGEYEVTTVHVVIRNSGAIPEHGDRGVLLPASGGGVVAGGRALGMVETRGATAAIESADAMEKAAEVEVKALSAYATSHGLANLCRVLFNLSEFTYLD